MSLKSEKNCRTISETNLKIYQQKGKVKGPPYRFINGRVIQSITPNYDNQASCNSSCSRQHSDSESSCESEVMSKPECISRECITYLAQVSNMLTYLMYFKEELDKEFGDEEETLKTLNVIFRDIQTLKSSYVHISQVISRLQRRSSSFYLYEVILDEVVCHLWNMYKPFLTKYSFNAQLMGNLKKEYERVERATMRARSARDIGTNVNIDSCLYTVFNSLFSLELMLTRYRNCYLEESENYKKCEEAKNIITNLLSLVNANQYQPNFLLTNKELNLLTGRSRIVKVNHRFIFKGNVTKLARRDDKPLARQLVLFSDYLYVTLLPSNIVGTSTVRQELSVASMTVTDAKEDSVSTNKWSLCISAKESVQDFFFDSAETKNTWKNKLLNVIKEGSLEGVNKKQSTRIKINSKTLSIGEEAPPWQKDYDAGYCNGLTCDHKFNATIRRHHCRADGLLYCDSCSNFRVNLEFERGAESRVCEICYDILKRYAQSPEIVRNRKEDLNKVMKRKTHIGKKNGWLSVKEYNKDKNIFTAQEKYFCVIHCKDPILTLYEKQEDKNKYKGIILLGMRVKTVKEGSEYYKSLTSTDFVIEHTDKCEVYVMKAPIKEDCQEWVECIRKRILTELMN